LKITTKRCSVFAIFLLLHSGVALAQRKPATRVSAENRNILIKDAAFHSASLGRDIHYRVLIPRGYKRGGRFPVLYLLHGLYGDYQNWDTRTRLENYTNNLHLLIVMPDADDSWYTNSATAPADKFEDYIAKDLIAEIDNQYRTIHDAHGRAVAGLSMGGYGAVKLALKYPELFAFAGSLSGAFNAPQNLDNQRPEFRAKLLEVFGNEGSRTRAENDIFLLLNTPHQVPYPYFYLACGIADFFLETNREFAKQLSSRSLVYEYHETAGGHSWEYWDGALGPLLKAIALKLPRQTPQAQEQ
jgi:putative tributyrin esterase